MNPNSSLRKTYWLGAFALLIVGVASVWYVAYSQKPGKLDGFASCLRDRGVAFYGAFWCPHCQNQKALFGGSASLLPYIECSTPDAKDQTRICKDKKIESYPTWEFPDGSKKAGEVSLDSLAQKTQCPLPK